MKGRKKSSKTVENYDGAVEILEYLIDGIDPDTKKEIPRDSVIHSPRVMRAFFTATKSLKNAKARAFRRSQLPAKTGEPWTPQEDEALKAAFNNMSVEQIAEKHERSVNAVESRLEALKLLKADDRKTPNRFVTARTKRSAHR